MAYLGFTELASGRRFCSLLLAKQPNWRDSRNLHSESEQPESSLFLPLLLFICARVAQTIPWADAPNFHFQCLDDKIKQ
jgi:hypothetical protein